MNDYKRTYTIKFKANKWYIYIENNSYCITLFTYK